MHFILLLLILTSHHASSQFFSSEEPYVDSKCPVCECVDDSTTTTTTTTTETINFESTTTALPLSTDGTVEITTETTTEEPTTTSEPMYFPVQINEISFGGDWACAGGSWIELVIFDQQTFISMQGSSLVLDTMRSGVTTEYVFTETSTFRNVPYILLCGVLNPLPGDLNLRLSGPDGVQVHVGMSYVGKTVEGYESVGRIACNTLCSKEWPASGYTS